MSKSVYKCIECGTEYDALYVSIAIQNKQKVTCVCGGQLKEVRKEK